MTVRVLRGISTEMFLEVGADVRPRTEILVNCHIMVRAAHIFEAGTRSSTPFLVVNCVGRSIGEGRVAFRRFFVTLLKQAVCKTRRDPSREEMRSG